MTVSRITQSSMGKQVVDNLTSSLTRLQKIQDQLSSGKRIGRPSDEPAGAVLSLRLRSSLDRNAQYARNLTDGKGWLDLADSSIQSASNQLTRARDLLVQGISSGSSSSRNALSGEVVQIRNGLVQVANTRFQDRPIFAGTAGTATAYDASGAYVGDSGSIERNVAPGITVRVNADASAVFGSGANSVFTLLGQAATHLAAGDTAALQSDLAAVDTALGRMNSALSDVGARANRLESLQSQNQSDEVNLKSTLSETEDVDITKTIMDLQLQQNAYQAALGATARVIQPSLIDFLR